MFRNRSILSTTVALTIAVAPFAMAEGPHDGDMLIGSSAVGGGQLLLDFDFGPTPDVIVSPFLDLGNGNTLYTSTEPGFDAALTEIPEGVYQLTNNVQVSIKLLAFDAGAALQVNGIVLDQVDETAVYATYDGDEGLHGHPIFRLIIPTGNTGNYDLTFQLLQSNGSTYSASESYTLTLSTVPEPAALGLLGLGGMLLGRRRR